MKPRLFIGSSTERLLYALALQDQLSGKADVTVWNQGVFGMNAGYLESLLAELRQTDFGVFVFAPDDLVTIKEETSGAIRDNVLFECGLFMGGLGRERAFFVMPKDHSALRLPTDLLGVSTALFDAGRAEVASAVGPACFKILQAIDRLGIRQDRLVSPSAEVVRNPRILCACSPQFFALSFAEDVKLIEEQTSHVSSRVTQIHDASSERLIQLLMDETFDILHIAAFVDPKSGDVYFSDVAPEGPRDRREGDVISASSFSKLIELCKAKLVVLATCDSLILAARLARVTNMIAATDWVRIDDMLAWELSFYKCIAKGISIASAFETATSLTRAPMLLLTKRDVAFAG